MMLLTVKKRQTYLKELGFYTGAIDGSVGKLTKAAYKALQDKYFTRAIDRDGLYGKDTDKLLRNAYKVHLYCKNFKLEEFKCGCRGKYCTGYPVELNAQLLQNIQKMRDKYGSITVTSGVRCKPFNSSLRGSSTKSRHMSGKALDIKNYNSRTLAGRKGMMNYWKSLPKFNYTYCNENGSYPNMGTAIHVDVK